MVALVKMGCVLENPKRIEAGFRCSFHEPRFRGFEWPRPAYSRALGRLSDDLKPHQPPALEFFTAINSFCGSRHNRRHNTRTTLIFKVFLRYSLPCAMVLRLIRGLPGDRAFLPPSPCRCPRIIARSGSARIPQDLTPASGRQDHTTSPSASAPLVLRGMIAHGNPPRHHPRARAPTASIAFPVQRS